MAKGRLFRHATDFFSVGRLAAAILWSRNQHGACPPVRRTLPMTGHTAQRGCLVMAVSDGEMTLVLAQKHDAQPSAFAITAARLRSWLLP
jgi:hypothetical protein